MKYPLVFYLLLTCSMSLESGRDVVDEIRAVVYHQDGATAILTSDVKPDLDGTPRTLRDVVLEELMVLDAQRLHVNISEADIDRFLGELQRSNNMSRASLEHVMEEMGYSYLEGKEKLRRRQMAEQAIDFRIKSDKRFIVQREDVVKFDEENPVFKEASYTLVQVVVPDEIGEKELSQKELEQLSWEEPFTVKESELADDKKFIARAKNGTIVDRDVVGEGIELTRLIEKKPHRRLTVDERYDQILNIIRMQRFEKLMQEYSDELLNKATIRFTYPEDRILVLEQGK